jgi:hypothetical protein
MFFSFFAIFFFIHGTQAKDMITSIPSFAVYGGSRKPYSTSYIVACIEAMECGEVDVNTKNILGFPLWGMCLSVKSWERLCRLCPRLDLLWCEHSSIGFFGNQEGLKAVMRIDYLWKDLHAAQLYVNKFLKQYEGTAYHGFQMIQDEINWRAWAFICRRCWIAAVVS